MPSKYVVTRNPALPAYCSGCRKSADGKTDFVDFQLDLDYYGAVVFCEDCAREIASVFDLIPVAKVDECLEQIENLIVANRELMEENERVRAALNSVLVVRPDLRPDSDRTDDLDSEAIESATSGGTSKNK